MLSQEIKLVLQQARKRLSVKVFWTNALHSAVDIKGQIASPYSDQFVKLSISGAINRYSPTTEIRFNTLAYVERFLPKGTCLLDHKITHEETLQLLDKAIKRL